VELDLETGPDLGHFDKCWTQNTVYRYCTRAGTGSMVALALDSISFLSALKNEYGEPVDSGASFTGKSFSYLSSVLYFIDGCWIH
jgi:hypothetical protein